jgi:hypothetical protein
MNIGEPKRTIEIEPVVVPVPEHLPVEEPAPAEPSEPAPAEPSEPAPAEPSEPAPERVPVEPVPAGSPA